jgi:hypothetical protein
VGRDVDEDELIEHWTLVGDELTQLAGKRGPTRLAFALSLKFHQRYGRFPRGRAELPDDVVEFVAKAVRVPAVELGAYEWDGRTSKYHRTQIRRFTGFRECAVADAEKATDWLVERVRGRAPPRASPGGAAGLSARRTDRAAGADPVGADDRLRAGAVRAETDPPDLFTGYPRRGHPNAGLDRPPDQR